MTQIIIGYFCGTGLETAEDASLLSITANVNTGNCKVLCYDGCHVHGGGLFADGVEEQADAFIADLKQNLNPDETHYQINLVAHSRGVLSALIAIKKIQADPELRDKVSITGDFHDPVPGNFQITSKLGFEQASVNQLRDLSDCDIVKKVYITLQEHPILPIAFDMLIPKFHHKATVEIETIPGYHDVQHRYMMDPDIDHRAMLSLGVGKTFSILQEDGFTINPDMNPKQKQIDAYDVLTGWAKTRPTVFEERDLHFGGQIIANNHAQADIDVINWRHAQLKGVSPNHVLYGTTHPDYNYRKTLLEQACDVLIAVDHFEANNSNQAELVANLRAKTEALSKGSLSISDYKDNCKQLLKNGSVDDAGLNKAINYLGMMNYFTKLEKSMDKHITDDDILFEKLHTLKINIIEELTAEIESGKTIDQLHASNAVKIINNTAQYLEDIYANANTAEQVIEFSEQYANDNIRLGRNWHLGSKIIVGAIIALAATVVGFVIGAAIGFGIGLACGASSGPGALVTACVAAFIGGLAGAVAGASTGIYAANHFFKPSPVEHQLRTIVDVVKAETIAEEDPSEQEDLQPSVG